MSAPEPGPTPSLMPLGITVVAQFALPLIAHITYGARQSLITTGVCFMVMLYVRRQFNKRMRKWLLDAAAHIRGQVDACNMHPKALELAEQFEQQARRRNV